MGKFRKLIDFLDYVLKNKKFCTKEAARYFDLSQKTIQRYVKDLQDLFGIEMDRYEKGCYVIKDDEPIRRLIDCIPDKETALLLDILSMIHPKFLESSGLDRKKLERIIASRAEPYLLKEYPFEELINSSIIADLKKAVKFRHYVDIVYEPYEQYEYRMAKPLKIVYAEGNWYLAVLTDDEINNGFKFLRINFIKSIKPHKRQFKKVSEAEYFLQNFQSLFSAYLAQPFDVVVEVDKEVARHFRVKKFLASQRIIEDGERLRLGFTVTNDEEILMLAKRWMPHMRIIKPQRLQKRLEECAKRLLGI